MIIFDSLYIIDNFQIFNLDFFGAVELSFDNERLKLLIIRTIISISILSKFLKTNKWIK